MSLDSIDCGSICGNTRGRTAAYWDIVGVIDTSLAQKTGWLIAVSRTLIALLVLLMAVTDPQDASLAILLHKPDDAWAFGYVLAALALLALFHADWYWNFRLRLVALGFDIVFYVGVMFLIEPMDSGFFAATFALLTFNVIAVNIHWSWRHGLMMLAAANIVCIAMIAEMHFADAMPQDAVLIRRQAYLLSLSLLLMLTSVRFQNIIVPHYASDLDGEMDAQLRAALGYARRQLGAKGGAICWGRLGQPTCGAQYDGSLSGARVGCTACSMAFERSVDAPTMFSVDRAIAVTISARGRLRNLPWNRLDLDFINRAGVRQGIFIPLLGTSGQGRLLLSDIPFQDTVQLHLAKAVAAELQNHLDKVAFHQAAEQLALMDLRQSVARDLHDSVAQTLAGTRFWLQSIKGQDGSLDFDRAQFEMMSEALAEEHANLREVIEGLRLGEYGDEAVDLAAQLRTAAVPLSQIWQMEIEIDHDGSTVMVSQTFSLGILQLLREAVSNAARHGRADHLQVAVSCVNNLLELSFIDDGGGFDPQVSQKMPNSIKQRTVRMGGNIALTSEGGYTRITLGFALAKE